MRRDDRDDRGSLSLELVILGPGILLFILLVIFAGRVALAGQSVQQAADEAARSASIARTQGEASSTAAAAARTTLSQQDLDCSSLTVKVNTSGFSTAVGQSATVSATVTCNVRTGDLALPGAPGTRRMTATAISPLDTYRER